MNKYVAKKSITYFLLTLFVLKEGDMKRDYVILINQDNVIDRYFYKNFELIEVKNVEQKSIKIEKKTYENYLKLKKEILKKENIEIGIDNAYRDFEEQERICQKYIKYYGEKEAYKLAAIPGTSEHHSGLAIDITLKKDNGKFADSNDELYEENIKFLIIHKYLHKFGFILRYPMDKVEITKYNYEPWHIRYIGKKIAKICYEKDIALEEYKQRYN